MNSQMRTIGFGALCALAIALPFAPLASATQGCCPGKSSQHQGHQGSDQQKDLIAATVKRGVQYATIVADGGYVPAAISVKAGMPLELTFKLGKRPGCASTVSFPSLKIKKEIPAGKAVTIKFTPKKAGDVLFECGMGMYTGKVVVK